MEFVSEGASADRVRAVVRAAMNADDAAVARALSGQSRSDLVVIASMLSSTVVAMARVPELSDAGIAKGLDFVLDRAVERDMATLMRQLRDYLDPGPP